MTDDSYRSLLRHARDDYFFTKQKLVDCRKEQNQLERRLAGIRETIVALSRLLGERFEDEDEVGLTDAIRQVYKTSADPMSSVAVQKQLVKLGYDLSKYASPESASASISTVVKRLADNREILPAGTSKAGRQMYKWAGSTFDKLMALGTQVADATALPNQDLLLPSSARRRRLRRQRLSESAKAMLGDEPIVKPETKEK